MKIADVFKLIKHSGIIMLLIKLCKQKSASAQIVSHCIPIYTSITCVWGKKMKKGGK